MQWGRRHHGGVLYDLTHLDPFIAEIPIDGDVEPIKARVRFGSHVFTTEWSVNYIDDYKVMDGATPRCFCPIRYAHSVHLRGLVERHCAGRVLFDSQRKLVLLGNPPGVLSPYAIFFTMTKAKHDRYELDIVVVSAHEHPRLSTTLGMPFPKLATIVASGQPIPWPQKRK